MQAELLRLWDDTRFTVLFVTHSIPEAVRVGSRILLLSAHPGQVRAELAGGDPDDSDEARTARVAHIDALLFDRPAGSGRSQHD
jgi:NitT/TauT family transport system ATP-binding protein